MENKSQISMVAWATLFKAYRNLREKAEMTLKQADLPPLSWHDVLWEVYNSPERRLRQFEICEKIILSKYNLSRLLDRLATQGLISKESCDNDKRGNYISITPAGVAMLDTIWVVYRDVIRDNFARHYSHSETQELQSLLQRVLDQDLIEIDSVDCLKTKK